LTFYNSLLFSFIFSYFKVISLDSRLRGNDIKDAGMTKWGALFRLSLYRGIDGKGLGIDGARAFRQLPFGYGASVRKNKAINGASVRKKHIR
jgi:hypothetical protein